MTKSKWVGVIAIRTETTQTDFLSDVLVAVASLDLKVPIFSYLRVPRVPFFHLIPVVYSQENRLFPFSGTRLLRPVYPSYRCCFTAAAAGLPDCLMKVLGRWSSDCYQLYIHSSSTKRSHVCRTSYGVRHLILVSTCLFRLGDTCFARICDG